MRTILYLIRKEFIQIFRNKFISKAIFAVPIVQMLILVPAITFEIKNINLTVSDKDMTPESRGLISKLEGSSFFNVSYSTFSEDEDLVRREFRTLRGHFDALRRSVFPGQPGFHEISMGMSGDYRIAVEEGSTIIRLGTIVFGEREAVRSEE